MSRGGGDNERRRGVEQDCRIGAMPAQRDGVASELCYYNLGLECNSVSPSRAAKGKTATCPQVPNTNVFPPENRPETAPWLCAFIALIICAADGYNLLCLFFQDPTQLAREFALAAANWMLRRARDVLDRGNRWQG